FVALQAAIGNVSLTIQCDSWKWSIDGSGGFSVASIRSMVDRHTLDMDQELNANCQKFNVAYKRAKRLGKSGKNDVDYLKRAQSIYRDEHKGVAFSQEDAWAVLRFHRKWDAPEQVDLTGDVPGATQEDLFGHDARPRPAGKPRPAKKTKSDATASTGGSSASTQFVEGVEVSSY
ncbi:hypothetical protein Tco_1305066, partial [Tanacetum coccineum]